MSVPEFAAASQLGEWARKPDSQRLPQSIRPPCQLPPGCRLGLVVRNMEDGTFQALKILHFENSLPAKEVGKFCRGTPYAIVFRQGPWALKKAVVSLIERLPGLHVAWFSLTANSKSMALRRTQSSQWAPADEELLAGIQYINDNALSAIPKTNSIIEQGLQFLGVGKTPAIIIMTLAMGRYHKEKLDLPTLPGRRRAKSLDNFRHRVRQVHEGVFLDDPYRDKIEESQRCQGRYNDVKLAKNCCRAYASDDIQKDDEPKNDERIDITMEEFMKLVHRTFPGDKPADISDIMAMLRRTVVFVFGLSALYVRFPSEKSESPIHCIQVDDLHKDVLAEGDKLFYGKYKSGSVDKPEHYDESVGREQSMIAESMSRYLSYSKSTQYMLDINEELLECLFNIRASNIRETWLPSSQESQDESSQVLPPPVYRHVEGDLDAAAASQNDLDADEAAAIDMGLHSE
ncbi:unnamed protein product [Durusdinium trenchii]|uniref:Uncharacterized protein n=1 Tax=Durusdinium trenchii TaxID=1381693 RepID=A0ABP0LLG3_9DINO